MLIYIVFVNRVFMLVTPSNGKCVRTATYPKLVLVRTVIHDNHQLTISAPGMNDFHITVIDLYALPKQVNEMFEQDVQTIDCGDEIAAWFSEYVFGNDASNQLRLVFYPHTVPTRVGHPDNFQFDLFKRSDLVICRKL